MLAFHQTKASKWNNLDVVRGMEEFVDVLVVVLCVVMECYLHPAHVNDSLQASCYSEVSIPLARLLSIQWIPFPPVSFLIPLLPTSAHTCVDVGILMQPCILHASLKPG